MNADAMDVLKLLERSATPKRAATIARLLDRTEEGVYASLIRLYDLGMAKIARQPVTGDVAGWEAA